MAEDTPTAFTEEGARRIIEEILRTNAEPRNPFPRRRRHVNLGGVLGDRIMFRLESELNVGNSTDARLMDACTLLTLEGPTITVMDDERKWFGRGDPAPMGDYGGDSRISGDSYSNCGWAARVVGCGAEPFYSIQSMGTWYRWIDGTLSEGQDEDPWRVYLEGAKASLGNAWDGDLGQDLQFDYHFVRPDDTQESGADLYLTLGAVCDVEPQDGMFFRAVFDEIQRAYKIVTICCVEEEE